MTTAAATSTTYRLDKSHSEATFQVRHLLTKVRGRFSDFEGQFDFDQDHPEQSRVQVTIQAASIDTNEPDRDKHLRSADFFETDTFPTLSFKSTAVTPRGTHSFDITGDLTIHGVTKPVTLAATYQGQAKDPWGNQRIAFEATASINRKDYGLHWNAALETGGFLVGDEITINLAIEALPA